jgi:hypothetical protein
MWGKVCQKRGTKMAQTFEEWWGEYVGNKSGVVTREGFATAVRAAWDAATYAMNQEQGIAANEAAKDARLQAAMDKIRDEYEDYYAISDAAMAGIRAIIKVAQG